MTKKILNITFWIIIYFFFGKKKRIRRTKFFHVWVLFFINSLTYPVTILCDGYLRYRSKNCLHILFKLDSFFILINKQKTWKRKSFEGCYSYLVLFFYFIFIFNIFCKSPIFFGTNLFNIFIKFPGKLLTKKQMLFVLYLNGTELNYTNYSNENVFINYEIDFEKNIWLAQIFYETSN